MGVYREQLLPRLQDKVMARPPMRRLRERACDGLAGRVLEVGFGTGLNARHYPDAVTSVAAVEPSELCMRIAAPRIAATAVSVERAGLTGERLDLPDEAFDAALSTWTLCTIPDVAAALAEIRRVLKTGGTFHFVEHGHAPDPPVARWQERVEPFWKPVAGGCHLSRDIPALIEEAGFRIDSLEAGYVEHEPKIFAYTYEGRATKV